MRMGDCHSFGLWCAANFIMFLVILAKNDALNQGTFTLISQNLRRLVQEMTQYFVEPTGCPVEFTSKLNLPRMTNPYTIPSSSQMRPQEGRVTIEEQVNGYKDGIYQEINVSQGPTSVNYTATEEKIKYNKPAENYEDNKHSTRKLEQLCKAYREKKKSFDRDLEDFQRQLDENEAGIAAVKKEAEEKLKRREYDNVVTSSVQGKVESQKIVPSAVIEVTSSLEAHAKVPGHSRMGSEQSEINEDKAQTESDVNKKQVNDSKVKPQNQLPTLQNEPKIKRQSEDKPKIQSPINMGSDSSDYKSVKDIKPMSDKQDARKLSKESEQNKEKTPKQRPESIVEEIFESKTYNRYSDSSKNSRKQPKEIPVSKINIFEDNENILAKTATAATHIPNVYKETSEIQSTIYKGSDPIDSIPLRSIKPMPKKQDTIKQQHNIQQKEETPKQIQESIVKKDLDSKTYNRYSDSSKNSRMLFKETSVGKTNKQEDSDYNQTKTASAAINIQKPYKEKSNIQSPVNKGSDPIDNKPLKGISPMSKKQDTRKQSEESDQNKEQTPKQTQEDSFSKTFNKSGDFPKSIGKQTKETPVSKTNKPEDNENVQIKTATAATYVPKTYKKISKIQSPVEKGLDPIDNKLLTGIEPMSEKQGTRKQSKESEQNTEKSTKQIQESIVKEDLDSKTYNGYSDSSKNSRKQPKELPVSKINKFEGNDKVQAKRATAATHIPKTFKETSEIQSPVNKGLDPIDNKPLKSIEPTIGKQDTRQQSKESEQNKKETSKQAQETIVEKDFISKPFSETSDSSKNSRKQLKETPVSKIKNLEDNDNVQAKTTTAATHIPEPYKEVSKIQPPDDKIKQERNILGTKEKVKDSHNEDINKYRKKHYSDIATGNDSKETFNKEVKPKKSALSGMAFFDDSLSNDGSVQPILDELHAMRTNSEMFK